MVWRAHGLTLVLAALGVFASASARTFRNRQAFIDANPDLRTIDFQRIATPQDSVRLNSRIVERITFEGGQSFFAVNTDFRIAHRSKSDWFGAQFSPPSDIAYFNSEFGWVMRVTFTYPVTAVGLHLNVGTADDQAARVEAFTNNVSVGNLNLRTRNDFTSFAGFADQRGIDRLDVSVDSRVSGNFIMFDDFQFGGPPPSTIEQAFEMEWLPVGDAGNPPDHTSYGQVKYNYRIAKHEVTNAQYAEFLNDVAISDPHELYDEAMTDSFGGVTRVGADRAYRYIVLPNLANKPVPFVDFYGAARMANWLHNGGGDGDTEFGAYDMRQETPQKIQGAQVYIPTEDEWYKAAYYDPTPRAGGGDNYWLYATRSDSAPINALANNVGTVTNPGPNVATYDRGTNRFTTVGGAGPLSESYYGTADQSGNIAEWVDAPGLDGRRVMRGGGRTVGLDNIRSTNRDGRFPDARTSGLGFRLSSAAPHVAVSARRDAVTEDGTDSILVVISRTGDAESPLPVNIRIMGSASLGRDYLVENSDPRIATIPAGQQELVLSIKPEPDNLAEEDETVIVSLREGDLYNFEEPGTATTTIVDDDFAPVAVADPGYHVSEDGVLAVSVDDGVLANDTDRDDGDGPENLLAEIRDEPTHGDLVLRPDGSFEYTPDPDYFGPDSFFYVASDGTNLSDLVRIDIEVTELADLRLGASTSREVVGAPGSVTHAISVLNLGPSDATGIVIDLALVTPAGAALRPLSFSTGSVAANQWTLDLTEEQSAVLQVTYDVSSEARGGIGAIATSATLDTLDQPLTNTHDDLVAVLSSIISPADIGVLELDATPGLNLQNGLFTQEITVTNNNPLLLAGFRLLIIELPDDVQVYNAHVTTAGGAAIVDSNNDLGPGESITLTIEFFRPNLDPVISPTYSIEALYSEDSAEPAAAKTGADLDRILWLENGDFLIEFSSTPGATYAIEYSHDMNEWHRVVPAITASANRTQWIDAGPPKTSSHPSSVTKRYYRIIEL